MRILAIDAGNSRIKWGVHEDGSWVAQDWVATVRAPRLAGAWAGLEPPHTVIAANVAGARVARTIAAAARRIRQRVRFIKSAAAQCGVRNAYADPRQLGPDRWAALIGARGLHDGPCVVVNAGTTMTVDALDAEGVFLGGMIVAGMDLMRGALARGTAALRPRSGRFAFFPARTADAIESGAVNALAGAASIIAQQLNGAVEVVDNLVLEGLVRIAQDSER